MTEVQPAWLVGPFNMVEIATVMAAMQELFPTAAVEQHDGAKGDYLILSNAPCTAEGLRGFIKGVLWSA